LSLLRIPTPLSLLFVAGAVPGHQDQRR